MQFRAVLMAVLIFFLPFFFHCFYARDLACTTSDLKHDAACCRMKKAICTVGIWLDNLILRDSALNSKNCEWSPALLAKQSNPALGCVLPPFRLKALHGYVLAQQTAPQVAVGLVP